VCVLWRTNFPGLDLNPSLAQSNSEFDGRIDDKSTSNLFPIYTSAIMSSTQSVQCFGKKKTATAVAHCRVSQAFLHTILLVQDLKGELCMGLGDLTKCLGYR